MINLMFMGQLSLVNYFECKSDYNRVNLIYLVLALLRGKSSSLPPNFVKMESSSCVLWAHLKSQVCLEGVNSRGCLEDLFDLLKNQATVKTMHDYFLRTSYAQQN